jgi:hypothetical protein
MAISCSWWSCAPRESYSDVIIRLVESEPKGAVIDQNGAAST